MPRTEEQHQNFVKWLRASAGAVFRVGLHYHHNGNDVMIPGLRIAPTAGEFSNHSDDGDLFVRQRGSREWRRIEVKHIWSGDFHSAEGWPFPRVVLGSVRRTDQMTESKRRPECLVLVSADMKYGAFVLWQPERWQRMDVVDKLTGKAREHYVCGAEELYVKPLTIGDESNETVEHED